MGTADRLGRTGPAAGAPTDEQSKRLHRIAGPAIAGYGSEGLCRPGGGPRTPPANALPSVESADLEGGAHEPVSEPSGLAPPTAGMTKIPTNRSNERTTTWRTKRWLVVALALTAGCASSGQAPSSGNEGAAASDAAPLDEAEADNDAASDPSGADSELTIDEDG
jgi:hypothetical protein